MGGVATSVCKGEQGKEQTHRVWGLRGGTVAALATTCLWEGRGQAVILASGKGSAPEGGAGPNDTQ